MELMQRLGARFEDEYVDAYIAEMKKYKGCCDNVWLPTVYGYPPLEKHREYADFHTRSAAKFRENGISVSLQLSNSLGHDDGKLALDCSGLYYEGSPARPMVGHDGTVAKICWCPRGETFRQYVATSLSYYAELQPDYIWIDDDFRAKGHGPVKFGCFCNDCISAFNTANGTSFSREELVETLMHGDLSWREKWIAFTRESLVTLLEKIAEKVRKVAPNVRFASQHGPYGAYTGYSLDFVFDAMRRANGGAAPASRPGGGAYDDHDPNKFIKKAMDVAYQNSILPDYVVRRVPEIESLPFNAFGKSVAGTALESSLYFAVGNTDMSYSMMMSTPEPMDFYGAMFKAFSAHRPYWERLSRLSESTSGAGIRYFQSENAWQRAIAQGEDFSALNKEPIRELEDLARDAIPFTYDKKENAVLFLHPETAKDISERELAFLLTQKVITDGESVDVLQKRGFSLGIECREIARESANLLRERFLPHAVKPNAEVYKTSPYGRGRMTCYAMRAPVGAEIVAVYEPTTSLSTPIFAGEKEPFGVAEMIISTKTGGKWAINGYCPWRGNLPAYKRDMLLDVADYLCDNSLPARVRTPIPFVLLSRRDEKGKTAAVSLLNCTVGESGEVELIVRNPASEHFTMMSQYSGTHEITWRREGEDYLLTLPSIAPWSVATVFVD